MIKKIRRHLTSDSRIWNTYGPAETSINCTCYLIDRIDDKNNIPIGRLLPNYTFLIFDEFSQSVGFGQIGELLIGGEGVFAGYLQRDDLTKKALVDINGHIFYRTGDLVKFNKNGIFYFVGRKDYQIKLRGQRIELGEIERCLLESQFQLSGCAVIQWKNDYLVAYVQSNEINENQLRDYCRSHLPEFMIPSVFIRLDKLPLNTNGKVDRKLLPIPEIYSSNTLNSAEQKLSRNSTEERVHRLWCKVLNREGQQIPSNASFFSVGGHSLLLIQLYHSYQCSFNFDIRSLSVAPFLRKTSIAEHAEILQVVKIVDSEAKIWRSFHIDEGNTHIQKYRVEIYFHNVCEA